MAPRRNERDGGGGGLRSCGAKGRACPARFEALWGALRMRGGALGRWWARAAWRGLGQASDSFGFFLTFGGFCGSESPGSAFELLSDS